MSLSCEQGPVLSTADFVQMDPRATWSRTPRMSTMLKMAANILLFQIAHSTVPVDNSAYFTIIKVMSNCDYSVLHIHASCMLSFVYKLRILIR